MTAVCAVCFPKLIVWEAMVALCVGMRGMAKKNSFCDGAIMPSLEMQLRPLALSR